MSSQLPDPVPASRWELLRDAVVFQGKLVVDGIRDAVMIPVSLVAAIMDALGIGSRAGHNFYDVVLFGRQTERWINLFGAADRLLPEHSEGSEPAGLDTLVQKMEDMVVEEYRRGGITTSVKDSMDRTLDKLHERGRGGGG